MNNITFFDTLLKCFLENNSNSSISFANIEDKIVKFGDESILKFYKYFIEKIDLDFKHSNERKNKYYVKETYPRTLLTSLGPITLSLTRYVNKETKKSFCYTRELLNIIPYQRLTLYAEYMLVKNSIEFNMSQAARIGIRNYEVSRSLVSRLNKKMNGSIHRNYPEEKKKIDVLYIEVDEIHANLQNKNKQKNDPSKNKICPVMCVHEGYINPLSKRKAKKNCHYFASSKLSYQQLYDVVYDYVDNHYVLNDKVTIFISGDGGSGIKTYELAFPFAIYVADRFHYKKKMKVIFKNETSILKIADSYLRNNNIKAFKELVKIQISKYNEQSDSIKAASKYILNNLEAIQNQNHEKYNCPCSMEGTISSKYARYITSSPYAFSPQGLENKLKILTLRANKYDLTFDDFLMLKYSKDEQDGIVEKINKMINIKTIIQLKDNTRESSLPVVTSIKIDDLNKMDYIRNKIAPRKETPII